MGPKGKKSRVDEAQPRRHPFKSHFLPLHSKEATNTKQILLSGLYHQNLTLRRKIGAHHVLLCSRPHEYHSQSATADCRVRLAAGLSRGVQVTQVP